MSTIENETPKDLSVPYTELFNVIDNTLKETQERFNAMQEKILRRMDVMTEQLKDLEKKIDSAIEEQGVKADLPS